MAAAAAVAVDTPAHIAGCIAMVVVAFASTVVVVGAAQHL